jgi:hypothetical protein
MTTRHVSNINDPYLKPYVRQRAVSVSSASGSPHSFRSNLAVVDGPTATQGSYYGVYLAEPPKGFPVSQVSSVCGSPRGSHISTGTSNGSSYNPPSTMNSSVAFPSVPVASHQAYQTVAVEDSSLSRRATVAARPTTSSAQPRPAPPSALKRERRKTLSSSTSAESVSNKDLRSQCKFVMGSISEALKRVCYKLLLSISC